LNISSAICRAVCAMMVSPLVEYLYRRAYHVVDDGNPTRSIRSDRSNLAPHPTGERTVTQLSFQSQEHPVPT